MVTDLRAGDKISDPCVAHVLDVSNNPKKGIPPQSTHCIYCIHRLDNKRSNLIVDQMSKLDKDDKLSETRCIFSIDEELGDDYEDAPLTWRGSPSSTLADCTLLLTNRESLEDKATYHVHRAVLGASDRRCLFFMKASQKNPTSIEIQLKFKAAQDVFPVMLDFVYFGALNIHTENAEALRHLAEFLECRPLRQAVNHFIESDFNVTTCVHYVSETHKFDDKALLSVAIRESSKLFGSIEIDYFSTLKPELFAAIVTDKNYFCNDPDRLSKTIIHYFHSNPEFLTPTLLVQLTNLIPMIRPNEAQMFLELVEKLHPPADGDPDWKELTPLCIHCSNSIAPKVWRDDEIKTQDDFFFNGKWSGDGPSRIFITRLVASLEYAKEQCQIQNQAVQDIQESAAAAQNEVMELTKRLAEQKVRKVITVQTDAGEDYRDEQGPASPRYSEVCRDLAVNLSHKLNEKEQIIQELERRLELKEAELERAGQMMVHLNARLKFFEILHGEGPPPSSSSNSPANRSASPKRLQASPSSPFSIPPSPKSSPSSFSSSSSPSAQKFASMQSSPTNHNSVTSTTNNNNNNNNSSTAQSVNNNNSTTNNNATNNNNNNNSNHNNQNKQNNNQVVSRDMSPHQQQRAVKQIRQMLRPETTSMKPRAAANHTIQHAQAQAHVQAHVQAHAQAQAQAQARTTFRPAPSGE